MKNSYLRIIVVILIIMSFFNFGIKGKANKNVTIFLVDRSLSMKNSDEKINDYLNKTINNKLSKDFYSIISFGNTIDSEVQLTNLKKEIKLDMPVEEEGTNIEKALRVAKSKFPENSNKQIVLLTDGKENQGDAINNIKIDDIELKILELDNNSVEEVLISNVVIPEDLSVNEKFNLEITLESNIKTKSNLKIYNNRKLLMEKEILIEKGENNYLFNDKIMKSGYIDYKIEIEPNQDTYIYNNVFIVNTEVLGEKNILVINGKSNESENISKLLSGLDININVINSLEVPITLKEINKYSSIIINDVSLENLDDNFIKNLSFYVEELGGGLLVTGGKNSFALGGYYKSELEKILPVNMEMKIDGKVPDLSLIAILDKSGSMSGVKLETAKEAAKLALDSLKIKDKIGVISFDTKAEINSELTDIDNKKEIEKAIQNIGVGGGTSIIPALEKAYHQIKDSNTKLKHVILITDGMAEKSGYSQILSKYNNDKITITTIGIGSGSDKITLNKIANETKGRFYLVDKYNQIPKIFTKETFLASKSYLNNKRFFPIVNMKSEIIKNIEKIPALNGYISSSIKPFGQMILASDNKEPILSTMKFGSGKTAAWCSDISGFWSKDFLNSHEGQKIIKNTIRWTYRNSEKNNLKVSKKIEGNIVKFKVKSNDFILGERLVIRRLDTMEEKNLEVLQQDVFEAEFSNMKPGIVPFKIKKYSNENKLLDEKIFFETINYPSEYNVFEKKNILSDLIVEKNAKKIRFDSYKEIFNIEENTFSKKIDISRYLIFLAMIIFIIDIANRKLKIFKKLKNVNLAKNVRKEKVLKEEISNDKDELDIERLLKNKTKKY